VRRAHDATHPAGAEDFLDAVFPEQNRAG